MKRAVPNVWASTYRPMPRDFPETFARVGWDGIEAETCAGLGTIRRWMIDFGIDDLRARRRAFLEAKYAAEGKRVPGRLPSQPKRYIMGRKKLTATASVATQK